MSRNPVVAVCWLIALSASGMPRRVDAAPMILEWSGPTSCTRESEVRATVERIVARETAPFTVRVRVREIEAAYAADLTFSGSVEGTRSLEAANCDSLSRAIALIIAVSADPAASLWLVDPSDDDVPPGTVPPSSGNAPESSPAAPAPTPSSGEAKRIAAPPPPKESSSGSPTPAAPPLLRVHARAGLGLEALWLPDLHFAGVIGGGVTHLGWRADLFAGYLPEFRVTAPEETWGADVLSAFAGLRLCRVLLDAIPLALCGGVRGHYLKAQGINGSTSETVEKWFFTLEPALLVPWSLGDSFSLEFLGAAVFPTASPSFVYSDERGSSPVTRELFRVKPGFSGEWNIVRHF